MDDYEFIITLHGNNSREGLNLYSVLQSERSNELSM